MPRAQAQSVEQFYKGRTITILVGNSPGGINDISARLRRAPYRPLHSRQSRRRGAEQSRRRRRRSPPTGSITTPRRTAPCSPSSSARCRSSPSRATRTPSSIRPSSSGSAACRPMPTTPICSPINASNPVKSVDEIKPGGGKSVTLGADASASSNLIFAMIAKEVLGLNIKHRARLHRRGAACSWRCRAASSTASIVGPELDQERPARPLQQARVPRADGVRPHHAPSRISRRPDRPRDDEGHERAGADRLRRNPVLHGAAVRGAARRPARSRQGACRRRSWRCARTRRSSTTPPSSASTSARSTATACSKMLARHGRHAEGRDRALQRDQREKK